MAGSQFVLNGKDGTFQFTPGKNGNLTYRKNKPDLPQPLIPDSQPVAKVVGPAPDTDAIGQAIMARLQQPVPAPATADEMALKKKRSGIVQSLSTGK